MLCTGLNWLLVILQAHIKYSHVLLYNSLYWQSVKHHQCPWIDAWRSLRPFASHTVQWVIEWVLYKPCEKKLSGFQNFVIRRQHEIYRGVHAVAVTATVGWLFMETYLIIWWHQAQSGHRSRPVTVCNCKCDCNCIIIIRPRRSRNAAICRSVRASVSLSSALWKNSGLDPDAIWHHRSDGPRNEACSGVWRSVHSKGYFWGWIWGAFPIITLFCTHRW